MNIIRTYKFKLYRHRKNQRLDCRINIAGEIYNHCLALHRRYYRLTGNYLNPYGLMKHLARLKKLIRYAHWRLVGSQAIQDVVERIDRAYKLFFRNVKAGIKARPPKFKKIRHYASFTLKQCGWKLLGGTKVAIQGTVYKFSKSREIPGQIKRLTVKRDKLGNFWLCFVVEEEIPQESQVMAGNSAGFDFGLRTFLVTSDGQRIDSPLYYRQALQALRHAQRELSRKVKGSHNWHKARKRVARIHARVVNQRRDWFFKLAHELTNRYDYLFLEDLNIRGMQRLWGGKVNDLARSEFISILKQVALVKGKVVHLINRFFPSSKMCAECGFINQELRLAERSWVCMSCGEQHDRDLNAATNIYREGASSLGLGNVRPWDFGAVAA
jgi:putative transposase